MPPASVRVWKVVLQTQAECGDGALRFIEGRAVLESRDRLHEMCRTTVLRQVPLQPLPHIDVTWVVEPWRHDANDGEGGVIERQLPADDGRIGVVACAPQAIADDRDRFLAHEERAIYREAGTNLRANPEQIEEVAADLDGVDAHRIDAGIDQIDPGRHHAAASANTGSAR